MVEGERIDAAAEAVSVATMVAMVGDGSSRGLPKVCGHVVPVEGG